MPEMSGRHLFGSETSGLNGFFVCRATRDVSGSDTLYLTPDSFGTRRDNYWEGPGNIHIVIALLEIKRDNNDLFSVFAIMKILAGFRLLLLGCWLGAAIFFVVVAQNVFAAMPTHE